MKLITLEGSKASYTRARQMVCEPLVNGLRTKCAYVWMGLGTYSALSAKWFAHRSPRTEICCVFARTQRELDAPGVLSMHWVFFARLKFTEN